MLKKRTNKLIWLWNKKYEIVFLLLSFFFFSFFKVKILNFYLEKTSMFLKIGTIHEITVEKNELLKQENDELRKLLKLDIATTKEKVFGQVLHAIFAKGSFWAKFNDIQKVKINSAIFAENRLIGFVEEINENFVKIRPITNINSHFSAKTVKGIGMLLAGNGIDGMNIELSNARVKNGDIVLFDDEFIIGVVMQKNILIEDFGRIKWVYILH